SSMRISGPGPSVKRAILQGEPPLHIALHNCGNSASAPHAVAQFPRLLSRRAGVDNRPRPSISLAAEPVAAGPPPVIEGSASILVYSRATFAGFSLFRGHETDLSAKRAPPEAQARLSCAHGNACRPLDPQAPPGEGPQAPVGVAVQRKNRLTRSRDFD